MAVDFYHRLVATGPVAGVRAFRARMHREYERTVARKTWTEIIPFSFEALYEIAPAARRVVPEVPFDPYDISVWPARKVSARLAELRYQFHTRNLEIHGLVRALSRALPQLRFVLVTFCLDDGDIESYRFKKGAREKWRLPPRRREFHWDRARRRFNLPGDDVFEDDEAERWGEEEMLNEALRHWEPTVRRRRARRRNWWNQPILRDLETEMQIAMLEVAKVLDEEPRT